MTYSYTLLDDPLATVTTIASGINDAGQIVGTYSNGSGGRSFLYSSGTYNTLLLTPPAVTESLKNDTGSSNSDLITSDPTVTGSGDANAVVHFTVDGNSIANTATADGSGAWTYTPTGLADGPHTIVASQTDLAGNTGTASLAFTLDTTAPAITESLKNDTGSSPSDRITSDPTVTGSGDANAVVHLSASTPTSALTLADGNGAWTYTPQVLADGQHTIVAIEADAAGNTRTASLTFMLDRDVGEQGALSLSIGDTTIHSAQVNAVHFAVGGLEAEDTALVTFTDPQSHSTTKTVSANGTTTVDLTGFADGPITASMQVQTDAAGNTFTPVGSSNTATLLTTTSVERFFDTATGDHFYTTSTAEAAQIRATLPTYHDEGAPWSVPLAGLDTQNVYRFFDVVTHAHFFTDSAAERANIDNTPSLAAEYNDEGVAFQDYTAAGPGTFALERFFNTISHLHTYGASDAENASIRSGGAGPGWVDEGASFIVHM